MMSDESITAVEDWVREARESVASGDFGRALKIHEEILQHLSARNRREATAFSNGIYKELLLEAIDHVPVLVGRCHFPAALELIRDLRPRLEASGAVALNEALDQAEGICSERILYTRRSPRALDVFVCCAGTDVASLGIPLVAELASLGVVVEPSPLVSSSSSDGSFGQHLLDSDFAVIVVSPEFFAEGWPRKEIEGLVAGAQTEVGRAIPVWHGISRTEVAAASSPLEKVLALDTQRLDIGLLALEIADLVRPDLAGGALNKAFYSSLLAQEPLSQVFTVFERPIRHEQLDDELVARIRLLRSAFLDGNRQMMRSWLDGFSRELDPYSAVVEWQHVARVFQEARSLQHTIRSAQANTPEMQAAFFEQLIPSGDDPESRELMISAFVEFGGLPADRLFVLAWAASQPLMLNNLDLGFAWGLVPVVLMISSSTRPMVGVQDDFIARAADVDSDFEVTFAAENQTDWAEPVLHEDEQRPWSKDWDVFISHASEDKERVVRPLAEALAEYGVEVWYDNFTLKPGASLKLSLDAGIGGSEFGIIVISEKFVNKEWPMYEFEALRSRADDDARLLTLWHGMTREDGPSWVSGLDPSTDLESGTESITALAREVLASVRPDLARFVETRRGHQGLLGRPEEEKVFKRINSSEVPPGDRNFDRLPKELVERVRLIRVMLFDGDPHSMDFWLEGFLRDYNPEREVAHWERIAAMMGEARLAIDSLQTPAKGIFKRRKSSPTVGPADIYKMLLMVDWSEQLLPQFRERYPEEILNVVLSIISSPTVIDVLDPE